MRCVVRRSWLFVAIAWLLVGCTHDKTVVSNKYVESGRHYLEDGKYPDARIQFQNATKANPDNAAAHFGLAQALVKLQQDFQAGREFTTAIDQFDRAGQKKEADEARIDLANLLMVHGDFQQAKATLDATNDRQNDNPDFHAALANYYAGVRILPSALKEMQTAIKLDPKRSDFFLNLGILQLAAEQFDAAEASFKQAVAMDPNNVNPQIALGSFYKSRGRLAEAEQQYRRAIDVNRSDVGAREDLIRVLVLEGNNLEAEEFARKTKQDLPNDPQAYSILGNYYFSELHDIDRAIPEYEAVVKDHPKDKQARGLLVQLLILKGRLDDAQKLNDETLRDSPQDVNAQIFDAEIKLGRGNVPQAVSGLQGVVAANPDNAMAHYQLGNAYFRMNDSARAESEWREAERLRPDMIEVQQSLAQSAIHDQRWSDLSRIANSIIQARPNSAAGYAFQAEAAVNLHDRAKALESAQKAIEVDARNPMGYVELGNLRLQNKDYDGAEKSFYSALAVAPYSTDAVQGLMHIYEAQKNPDKAIATVNAQIAKSPNSGFYDLLGTALSQDKNDFAGAEQAFRKAIELDKSNTDAILKLAQILEKKNQGDEAMAMVQQALKDHPQDMLLLLFVGEREESRQNWDAAKAAYQKMLEIQPNNPAASNNLASLMLQQGGNVDVALAMAQTARRGMPDSPDAADTLGWAYYKKGAYTNAISLFKEAVQRKPDSPAFQYHLGLAYKDNGDAKLAREHLQRAIKIDPNFPEADDARNKLAEL